MRSKDFEEYALNQLVTNLSILSVILASTAAIIVLL